MLLQWIEENLIVNDQSEIERYDSDDDKRDHVTENLNYDTNRSKALSAKLELCATLHWLGNRRPIHYQAVGDRQAIFKDSVCVKLLRLWSLYNSMKLLQGLKM